MGGIDLDEPAARRALCRADVIALEQWMATQRAELERLRRRLRAVEAEADLAELSLPAAAREASEDDAPESHLGTPFRGDDADLQTYFWREVPSVRAVVGSTLLRAAHRRTA